MWLRIRSLFQFRDRNSSSLCGCRRYKNSSFCWYLGKLFIIGINEQTIDNVYYKCSISHSLEKQLLEHRRLSFPRLATQRSTIDDSSKNGEYLQTICSDENAIFNLRDLVDSQGFSSQDTSIYSSTSVQSPISPIWKRDSTVDFDLPSISYEFYDKLLSCSLDEE